MKLKINADQDSKHTDLVSCLCWINSDELLTCSDDQKVLKWNMINDEVTQLVKLPDGFFPIDINQLPKPAGGKAKGQPDIFLIGSSDGKVHFLSKTGRLERSIDSHNGSVLCCRWSYDGNAYLTAGEDGLVKIWSRSGMLRSTLIQNASPVYSVCWSPNADSILHTNGNYLVIKSLQPSIKPLEWKAHDGVILKTDWNAVNNRIVSCGEDCRYKVWDIFGLQLYASIPDDYPITSISWAPDGELFAIGSFNTLRLCDKAGWSHSLEKPNSGSIFDISWSPDGSQLAGACANSKVVTAHIVERSLSWRNFDVVVSSQKHIRVTNVMNDAKDNLDFRDRIIKVSLGFGYLVVVTSSQCYIYSTENWNTPMIFDLKNGTVSLVKQAEKHFILIDDVSVQLYSYEGRFLSTPKYAGIRLNALNNQTVALSNDTIALRDRSDEKAIYMFDAASGKPIGDGKAIHHTLEVVEIALSRDGTFANRQLTLIDRNRDLYIRAVQQYGVDKTVKLSTMVTTMQWHTSLNMFAAVSDTDVIVWYYPTVAYVDGDILPKTLLRMDQSDFGKNIQILSFDESTCALRRGDGSCSFASIPPYPSYLHKFASENKWNDAVRICRFVKDDTLWACLAGMAANAKELTTAEIAYAAIDEAGKVQFINYVKDIPSKEGRAAAMALFCRQIQDAESMLLQAGLFYRAIQMHVDLFNWDRALELAVKHKTHVDTVLGYRQKYLQRSTQKENNKKFIQFSQGVEVDWAKINSKIESELQKESQRPGAKLLA